MMTFTGQHDFDCECGECRASRERLVVSRAQLPSGGTYTIYRAAASTPEPQIVFARARNDRRRHGCD